MFESAARNLRTTERFLISPSLSAQFGTAPVFVCDISVKGARFTHTQPLEMGAKAMLRLSIDGRPSPLAIEGVVVWTQADTTQAGRFVSGARLYAQPDVIGTLLRTLQA